MLSLILQGDDVTSNTPLSEADGTPSQEETLPLQRGRERPVAIVLAINW